MNMLKYLRRSQTTESGHDIKGPMVLEGHIEMDTFVKDSSVYEIIREVSKVVTDMITEEGLHPGDVAITFDEFDFKTIFDKSDEFVRKEPEKLTFHVKADHPEIRICPLFIRICLA